MGLALSFVIHLATLPAYESYDVWVFLPLFVLPNTFCVVYLIAYLPETRGREIHEIVEELKATCGIGLVKKLSTISAKRRNISKGGSNNDAIRIKPEEGDEVVTVREQEDESEDEMKQESDNF